MSGSVQIGEEIMQGTGRDLRFIAHVLVVGHDERKVLAKEWTYRASDDEHSWFAVSGAVSSFGKKGQDEKVRGLL